MPLILPEALDYADVLIQPRPGHAKSRSEPNLVREFTLASGKKFKHGIFMAANMYGVGTPGVARAFHARGTFNSVAIDKPTPEEQVAELLTSDAGSRAWVTIGWNPKDWEKLERTLEMAAKIMPGFEPDQICLDGAYGYAASFVKNALATRKRFPKATIMGGNVSTVEGVEPLIDVGVDVIKVGIGPGSACTTRRETGVGTPQFTAVLQCAEYAEGKALINADGGIEVAGDAAKALAAGANFVMMGGMLAGHDEGGIEPVLIGDKSFVGFRGSSSDAAQKANPRDGKPHPAPEGKETIVPYRGSIDATMERLEASVKASLAYSGCNSVEEFPKRAIVQIVRRQRNLSLPDLGLV